MKCRMDSITGTENLNKDPSGHDPHGLWTYILLSYLCILTKRVCKLLHSSP